MWYELLLAALFGVLEGITEWLPISSTGHLILLERVVNFPVRPSFFALFEVVIQLGAILAVPVLFWHTLNPFSHKKTPAARRQAWRLWGAVLLAAIPSALAGLLLDDLLERYLHGARTVAVALIAYGVAFLVVERVKKRPPCVQNARDVRGKTAIGIGCFQALALIPGTSRSGATVLGGMLAGLSRTASAEFSFFLALPTMVGASGLKTVKFFAEGNLLTARECTLLFVGTLTAFLVSLVTIRTLLDFVRRHSFAAFGLYRILLGGAVLLTMIC